nr:MAG TPA: hypothetical protein [Caudoviricetes sp.]
MRAKRPIQRKKPGTLSALPLMLSGNMYTRDILKLRALTGGYASLRTA